MDVVAFPYNEYKFLVTNEQLPYVTNVMQALHGGSDPFPEGVVDSVYYDSFDRAMYHQSRNGENRKRKFRIRGYGDGRFHQIHLKDKNLTIIRKLKDSIQPLVITDGHLPDFSEIRAAREGGDHSRILSMAAQYGPLEPVIRVRYRRLRFRSNDFRMTLDTHIELMGFANRIDLFQSYAVLPFHVLEIKTVDPRPHLPLLGLSRLPQVSFSKFFMGLNLLETGDTSLG